MTSRPAPTSPARAAAATRTASAPVLAVLLAVLLATASSCRDGGGDGADDAAPVTTTGGAGPDDVGTAAGVEPSAPAAAAPAPPPPTVPPVATTAEVRPVSPLLLDEPPLPGFTRADDALGAGPLDLAAAAAAEVDAPAERALLETRGFEQGASRAWLDDAGDVLYVAVYDFRDEAGASAYLADGAEQVQARGATTFDVPDLPGALGFSTVEESPEGSFTSHAVAFSDGDRWVLALVGSTGSGRTSDDARALAAAQAARLT